MFLLVNHDSVFNIIFVVIVIFINAVFILLVLVKFFVGNLLPLYKLLITIKFQALLLLQWLKNKLKSTREIKVLENNELDDVIFFFLNRYYF